MKKKIETPNWANRMRYWRLFSNLAWYWQPNSVLKALALGWAHELLSSKTGDWVFTFGIRSLTRGWARAMWENVRRILRKEVGKQERYGQSLEILLVPQTWRIYYCAPCLVLGAEVEKTRGADSVAIVKPEEASKHDFVELARAYHYHGAIIELDRIPPVWLGGAFLRAGWTFLRLLSPQPDPELTNFFWRHPLKRFQQIFSSELMVRRFKNELTRLGVRKLVTMNEQHFPSSLLVAAANRLGIETHQILHGGMASPLYAPFQSQYCWPEYEFAARELERLGVEPSRLKIVPGLQVGSQIDLRRVDAGLKQRRESKKLKLLVLAQYHGYSSYGVEALREALRFIFEAAAARRECWEIVVRPHPFDSEEDLKSIGEMLDEVGLSATFTDPNSDLAEEAAKSSLVVTASSTGIFTAIASGTPSCLIWGPDQIRGHGSPPLDEEWVVHTVKELIGILDRIAQGGTEKISLFAEHQAHSLGLDDLSNAPKRFCEALFRERQCSSSRDLLDIKVNCSDKLAVTSQTIKPE